MKMCVRFLIRVDYLKRRKNIIHKLLFSIEGIQKQEKQDVFVKHDCHPLRPFF